MREKNKIIACAFVFVMCGAAFSAENVETDNGDVVEPEVKPWYQSSLYYAGCVSSATGARSMIFEDRPCWENVGIATVGLGDYGYIGGLHWSVISMTDRSPYYHKFMNEIDWGVFYGYTWKIADDWSLNNEVMAYWMCYYFGKGEYPADVHDYEWDFSQSLANPYLTPYWKVRRGINKGGWQHWTLGVKRTFGFWDDFSVTPEVFSEFGDRKMIDYRYKNYRRHPDHKTSPGLMALNFRIRLDYRINDWLTLYASIRQFCTINHEGRRHASENRGAPFPFIRDLTMAQVGFEATF